MAKNVARVEEELHLTLASLPPGPGQMRFAVVVVLAIIIGFGVAAGPLSSVQLKAGNSVVPALIIPTAVTESITAALLYAQFSILGSVALATLATGYLFTSLCLIAWVLTIPGVFAPDGLFGAGLQSSYWLALLWHAAFSLFVIAYALLKDSDHPKRAPERARGWVIIACVIVVPAVVCAATFLLIAGDGWLPAVMLDEKLGSSAWFYRTVAIAGLSVVALAVLWWRRRSVLDLWLMVVMSTYASGSFLVAARSPGRYSTEWYAARGFEFIAGSLVLFVLLYEISVLYGQLLSAVLAQRREREARLVTGDAVTAAIAHEIKQPLTAMLINVSAESELARTPSPRSRQSEGRDEAGRFKLRARRGCCRQHPLAVQARGPKQK